MKELYFKTFSLLESKNISSDDIAEGFSQLGTFFTSAGYFNEAEGSFFFVSIQKKLIKISKKKKKKKKKK